MRYSKMSAAVLLGWPDEFQFPRAPARRKTQARIPAQLHAPAQPAALARPVATAHATTQAQKKHTRRTLHCPTGNE